MKLRHLMSAIIIIMVASACSTPYQKKNAFRNGHNDYPVGQNSYYVSYEGNRWTDTDTVSAYWYRRAAEICGGPDKYEVIETSSRSGTAGPLLEDYFIKEGRIRCK